MSDQQPVEPAAKQPEEGIPSTRKQLGSCSLTCAEKNHQAAPEAEINDATAAAPTATDETSKKSAATDEGVEEETVAVTKYATFVYIMHISAVHS